MTESWRCFVAVPLSEALVGALARTVTDWRADPAAPDLRWTEPAGWHLTLAFLGDIDPEAVPSLLEALRSALDGYPAWRADTGELGTFPGPLRARVLWYGVGDADGRLARLAHAARTSLAPLVPSLRSGSPFRAHVTLARARQSGIDLGAWLAVHAGPRSSLRVDQVVLYRSLLGAGRPARYESLGAVALPAPRGAIMDAEAEASTDG